MPSTSTRSAKTVVLPSILTQWPWVRTLSEHYEVSKAESSAWVESFHAFEGRGLEAFRKCDFSLLSSLTYSPREKSLIRLGCDLMHLFFVFDEYTDVEDRRGVEAIHNRLKAILSFDESSSAEGDDCLSKIAKDFWLNAQALVPKGASCLHHFSEAWGSYTSAVVQEAEDRANRRYRSFEDYMRIRRNTAGGAPTLALAEFGLNLPDEVFYHPIVASLREKAELLIVMVNDIYSYVMEKSRGLAIHNAVEVVMRERKISLQASMDWLGKYCDELAEGFLRDLASLPSWGDDVDSRVAIYVNGLGQWVRGIDDWHFESTRYFGSEAPVIKQTRIATLIPPSRGYISRRPQRPRRGSSYDTL